MLHLPSQTNHAFQDIWRQLANYWRALAPERQLGQPGSNSASMEQNMLIIRLKICWGYSGPGLPWVSWWHWDLGQGPGLWQARSGWHDDYPGDDTGQMTHDRWQCHHNSHSLLLSHIPLLCEDEGCPPDHLSGSLAGDCVWCWGKMEEWMFPPENRNKSTRVGQMPGGWARTAAGFYLELFSWEIYWL